LKNLDRNGSRAGLAAPPRTADTRPVTRPLKGRERLVRFLAWCVHFYTALGLVAAAGMAVLIIRGGPEAFRSTFMLMFLAMLVDSTDGTLARLVRVKEVLPGFDGRKLDDLIDFMNYTALPLLLIWRAGILPEGQAAWLLVPLLASAYGFCQVSAKTDDGYFLGFPSYWNVVAFYMYVLRPDGWASLSVLLALALLTFVPSRYLYPSQPGRLNQWGLILGGIWACLMVWVLWRLPSHPPATSSPDHGSLRSVALVSLFFPAYYMLASWGLTLRIWLRTRS
jgi:phosphatidylcholine synthase